VAGEKRTLILMRHAKAEPFGDQDHERVLTDRGRRDATEAGAWLASRGLVPDHAFVSPAARTTSTWEALAAASGATVTPTYDDALYSGSPDTVLDVLRTAPNSANVLVLVGHNPTVAYLAQMLSDGIPDPAAFRAMSQGYPSAALTVLSVPGVWADLSEGSAAVVDFHVGHAPAR
jgi:phosphohistidine phosphatase